MEFPKFTDGDPTSWLSKAKQYFGYYDIQYEQKVSFASYHLNDEANEWWQATSKALNDDQTPITWEVFEAELWARFGPTAAKDFDEALSKIQQTGTLQEYQREFERLQNKVSGWTQKALIGTYIGGLKDNISDGIRMFQPKTLKAAIELARMKDEQLQRQRRFTGFTNKTQRNPSPIPPAPNPTIKTGTNGTPKRLSWDEMKRKRSLGLCFSCDERYTPDHRCQKSQLLLIEGIDDSEDEDDDETPEPEITLQALTGWGSPKTIRTNAEVSRQRLVALIDSGSTHNFVTDKVAGRLNLKLSPAKPFHVRVADGHPIRCTGIYKDVPTIIDGVHFRIDFFPLPIKGQDLVLGMQWLQQLGPTLCDWTAQTMSFSWAGQQQVIHGLQGGSISQAQTEEILQDIKLGQACFTIAVHQEDDAALTIPTKLQPLLEQFDAIFDTPDQLPPSREIEHHIILREGADPVNVRPYRYAHFQKEEIERQVQAMMSTGFIQPSSSPFSSPVLLVKKKDGSWRFCTDYRALNAATVKDRFPIPTVDDMLDELHGATVFTKLDLTAGYHQVRVHPADIHKTAFCTHNGHYEYLVMPFGLCNPPSTFQALMNSVFREHLCKFVLVFF